MRNNPDNNVWPGDLIIGNPGPIIITPIVIR